MIYSILEETIIPRYQGFFHQKNPVSPERRELLKMINAFIYPTDKLMGLDVTGLVNSPAILNCMVFEIL